MSKAIQACDVEHAQGVRYFRENGLVVFVITDKHIYDLRETAPFKQVIPCPYCGVAEDKGHIATKHIDTHKTTVIVY